MKNNISFIALVVLLVLNACSNKKQAEQEESSTDSVNIVMLTKDQMNYAEIETGKFTHELLTDRVECNGSVEADPNQKATVSAPIRGNIKKILVHIGDYVKQGEILAILAHADYVKLQQEYLETKSQYEYYKEDFKRQGELTLENAASMKTMQQARNEFNKTEARLFALKKQLHFIGINPDSLTVNTMTSEIALRSPITGFITEVNGQIGMLSTEEDHIFRIVGIQNAILHLKVYEKDALLVSPGQLVSFSIISQPDKNYSAKIKAATRSVDENNTINIHAKILDNSKDILPGMYVNAHILVSADSVYALPDEAIVTSERVGYIFLQIDSLHFEPVEVQIGRKYKNYSEILNCSPELLKSDVVTSGAYYLFSELNKED